jgi:hypothetical protein
MTTETEQTARRFARDRSTLSDGGRYFRFNVPSGLDKIAMEDSKSKSAIIAVTDRYLEDQETFKKVENCAKILRDVKRMCSHFPLPLNTQTFFLINQQFPTYCKGVLT